MSLASNTAIMADTIPSVDRPPATAAEIAAAKQAVIRDDIADPAAFVTTGDAGLHQLYLMVGGITCAACVYSIEKVLEDLPGLESARVNMTTRRLLLRWKGDKALPLQALARMAALGYDGVPFDRAAVDALQNREDKALLKALGIAAFGMMNVMLLSVSVWAGHAFDMAPATRDLMHWVSALIALPIVFFAGQPFFWSAAAVLRRGRTNMDVPISLALVLAVSISLYESFNSGAHAWFDAAVMLLTFLLAGRYLDQRMRMKAQTAANHLSVMTAMTARVIDDATGKDHVIPANQVVPGMKVRIAAGDVIPVDGKVIDGAGDIDTSLVTGESLPRRAMVGDMVFAGTTSLSAPLIAEAQKDGGNTLLQEIVGLMEAAETSKAKYRRIADRASALYAPVVHVAALLTFAGWFFVGDLGVRDSVLIAMAVLIITCPCALALAVPAVQVVASSRLMKQGILLKSGDALERLATVDVMVFDKTGTLTMGQPELVDNNGIDAVTRQIAKSLAMQSKHPLSRALDRAFADAETLPVSNLQEVAGSGVEGMINGKKCRLGHRDWVAGDIIDNGEEGYSQVWLSVDGMAPVCFSFRDPLKTDAAETIRHIQAGGTKVMILSGDRRVVVDTVARQLGIDQWQADCNPAEKLAVLEQMKAEGRVVAMVGDGLNDAPSLAAADISLSPGAAADISRTAADIVFQGDALLPVWESLHTARTARRLVNQNFALAIGYNVLAIPIAVAGFVTPLIAAIAMSGSSLIVTLNAMRLGWQRRAVIQK